MAETDMRQRVVSALKTLDAISVENGATHAGTPDVNFIEGWIECKWLREWPPGIVSIEHYTPQQRVWAIRRRRRGGRCWMLLQVREEWLLIDGAVAAVEIGKCTREQLYQIAEHVWPNGLDDRELKECISRQQSAYSFTGAGKG